MVQLVLVQSQLLVHAHVVHSLLYQVTGENVQASLETPAERIARKKREAVLRQEQAEREAQWAALIAHAHGIMLVLAQFDLGYKPNFKKGKG